VTTPRSARPPLVRRLELGDLRLTYVVDGVMEMVTEAFFPAIPSSHWAADPATVNAGGRVVMGTGALLVESGSQAMLIDLGWGSFAGETMYGPVRCGELLANLAATGRSPEDIDVVAYTHLHVDHVGWTFDRAGSAVFPRARSVVAGLELEAYLSGGVSCAPLSRTEFLLPFRDQAEGFDDGAEVFPGVRAFITPGHSPGHTSYVLTTGGQRLIVFGDVFHVAAQIGSPSWLSGPDHRPEAAIAARHTLLGELTRPGTLGFAFHFADEPFGRVVIDESGDAATWVPLDEAYELLPRPS
jgi:glyoxylase-like metal-dependent hydrolase (beta-lactamase superfamily II)